MYWARNYYLLWVEWNWVKKFAFTCILWVNKPQINYPISRNPWQVIISGPLLSQLANHEHNRRALSQSFGLWALFVSCDGVSYTSIHDWSPWLWGLRALQKQWALQSQCPLGMAALHRSSFFGPLAVGMPAWGVSLTPSQWHPTFSDTLISLSERLLDE